MEPLKPILVAHLLEKIEGKLLELLRDLDPKDWEAETIVPGWRVRHIVAHLLDTQLRKLSMVRDGYMRPDSGPNPGEDLPAFISRLNRDGVDFYSRLSPAVLISLMKAASRESAEFHVSLDPFAKAQFAVSWAGEYESANWFDTARELTERWHHQQQIRLAVNKPGIMTPELYAPVLDTFMRALPFHYRRIDAGDGTLARFVITGDCGGTWHLYREGGEWKLIAGNAGTLVSETIIPQEIAWRVFTKGIARDKAAAQVKISGDRNIGTHILTMLSIVA